ncbi:L-rhamnose isomerase [candidate division KSB1 bacterium]|nr:L-rhamnose isomerase [candidate division KSB1 bacterium]RQW08933.1 MAG: sugar isomerase [candidate division KSB1 bacterium]
MTSMTEQRAKIGLQALELEFGAAAVKAATEAVKKFKVEIPSWIFGPFGGGRFGEYLPPGAARSIQEKLDDAAVVNRLTGATEFVAMHVLWDFTEDGSLGSYTIAREVHEMAGERGLKIGSVSPTYFLRGSHRNSYAADEKSTCDHYIEQTVFAGRIAKDFGVRLITLWFPDGSNYPGQIDLQRNYETMKKNLLATRQMIADDVWILLEYKVFEPGTYSTTIPDWGTAFALTRAMGGNTGVLVDLGHHFHSANIEQIVARLVSEGMRCGFHFNTRYAADDDHSVEPTPEMARIFYELVSGKVIANRDENKNWAYMIDQCSGRENRLHAIIHSVDMLQNCLAKAMLIDRQALQDLQAKDEIILANRLFNDALIHADVRPIVATARLEQLLPIDPMAAFIESGYQRKIEKERI